MLERFPLLRKDSLNACGKKAGRTSTAASDTSAGYALQKTILPDGDSGVCTEATAVQTALRKDAVTFAEKSRLFS